MKFSSIFLKTMLAALFLLLWAETAGSTGKEDFYTASGQAQEGHFPDQDRVIPLRHHSWGPDPGGIIYDGYYPPSYSHPGWPGYYPPYPYYPPNYEARKPWYEGEPPIPAGRLVMLVDPVEAKTYVNGYPLQRHPDLSYEVGLLEGEHRIEVAAEGYVSHKRTIRIRGGERLRLTIRLERIDE